MIWKWASANAHTTGWINGALVKESKSTARRLLGKGPGERDLVSLESMSLFILLRHNRTKAGAVVGQTGSIACLTNDLGVTWYKENISGNSASDSLRGASSWEFPRYAKWTNGMSDRENILHIGPMECQTEGIFSTLDQGVCHAPCSFVLTFFFCLFVYICLFVCLYSFVFVFSLLVRVIDFSFVYSLLKDTRRDFRVSTHSATIHFPRDGVFHGFNKFCNRHYTLAPCLFTHTWSHDL